MIHHLEADDVFQIFQAMQAIKNNIAGISSGPAALCGSNYDNGFNTISTLVIDMEY